MLGISGKKKSNNMKLYYLGFPCTRLLQGRRHMLNMSQQCVYKSKLPLCRQALPLCQPPSLLLRQPSVTSAW